MATPAEIANDMAAHFEYWHRRDKDIALLCRDAARAIRVMMDGQRLDGRTWAGLHRRLLSREGYYKNTPGWPNFTRARNALEELRRKVRCAP